MPITISPEEVTDAANGAYQAMSQANEAVLQAQNAINQVKGIAGSVPAKAKYAGLESACALALSHLVVSNFLCYGTNVKATLETLVELALVQDEKTAKEIEAQINALNLAYLKADTLKELISYRTATGDLSEYLEHVKSVWNKEYDPYTIDEEESRRKLLMGLSLCGYDIKTQAFSKDPVNLRTGNFIYDRVDLEIRGKGGFQFKRFYNSQSKLCGVLGQGWTHSFEEKLLQDQGVWKYIHGDGAEEPFYKKQDGTLQSALTTGNILYVDKDVDVIHKKNGEKIFFHKDGNVKQWQNGPDLVLDFIYQDNRLHKVVSSDGCYLQFAYDDTGVLLEISDYAGRKVCYEYDKQQHLTGAVLPDGVRYQYHYDSDGRILDIKNPRDITTVKNEYDEKGRIIRQDFPDGGFMTYHYDETKKQTELIERNGAKIIYRHDELGRHIATTDEAGTIHYTYNKHNVKSSSTDRRGNTTKYLYDNKGNLTAVVDPLGNKTGITYNADSKISVVKNPLGAKTTYRYDTSGRLMEIKNALGEKTGFAYDSEGNRNCITLADGAEIKMEHDKRGNITHMIMPDESVWMYEYDELNRVVASVDGNGNRVTYQYDSRDRIICVTDSKGNARTYAYNASGKITQVTDFDGYTYDYEYNSLNKPISIRDKEQNETKYEYDLMWNLTQVKTSDGGVREYIYDKMERLIKVILPNGGNICYEYDADGNRTGMTDSEGNKTSYEYDALNRLVKVTDAEGNETSFGYDKLGNRIWEIDALGNQKTYTYDSSARLISETDCLGNRTEYVRDCLSNVTEIRYPNGSVEKREYDKGGRLKRITNPMGVWEEYAYDGNGNIIEKNTMAGVKYVYTYDYQNRLTAMTAPTGGTRSWEYDVMGRVTALTDENGNRTEYEYSPNGNLISVRDPMGNVAYYDYDTMGHLTAIFRADDETGVKQKTTYLYDLMGLPSVVTDALGYEEHYQYNLNGKMIRKTDRDGYVTDYGYTPTGEIGHIDYADGKSVRYEYDALRHLAKVQDWNGEIRIENDVVGRAVKVQYQDGKEVSYTYGKNGERTGITYPDGKTVRYLYDESLRLSALEDGEDTITYNYDDMGRLTQKNFPNGCHTAYAYNLQGQLETLTHVDKEGILDAYTYRYDLTGNKTAIKKQRRGLPEESGLYTYGYDPLGRLSKVTKDGELLRTYGYDAFGNRTHMTEGDRETAYTYNAMNQLMSRMDSMSEETYAYDRRGNLSLIMENGSLKNSYTYGALNRLEQAVNGNREAATYEYNGLGHRVGKVVGIMKGLDGSYSAAQSMDIPDPMGSLEEQSLNPETKIRYTIDLTRGYHNLLEKEEAGSRQTYLWDGNVAGMREEKNGQNGWSNLSNHPDTSYYLQDELGSPIRLLDEEGNMRENYGYDEFGQDLYRNQGQIQPFGYTGYQSDRIARTYYAQAREYRAELGRFAGVDIIKGFAAAPYTLNEYGYCWGNPMVLVDLDGMFPSLSDISNGIKSATSSVVNAVTDIADKAIENVRYVGDNAVETVKNAVSDIKGATNEFYNEHKKTIDTIGKVTLTVGIGAVAVLGGIAIVAALPITFSTSAAVVLGAGIVTSGVVTGILGGVSNSMTGGSFLNGFCGGFANGCINMALKNLPFMGNFIAGFVGNEITENFNNMDIADPQEQKSQLEILGTSMILGIIQGIVGKGIIGKMEDASGFAKGTLAYFISYIFSKDLSFMISNSSYIFINGILEKYVGNKKNEGKE